MRHLIVNKRSRQSGFTMIELLVVTLMIGVMAAIASPGMLAFVRRSKVSAAQSNVQRALLEIQREAMKRGVSCSVTFPSNNASASDQANNVLTISSNCLVTGTVELEQVRIRHNLPATTLELFNFRGETGADKGLSNGLTSDVVIVLTQESANSYQKCVAISNGLGLVRTGIYPSNNTTTTVNSCSPTS